MDTPKTNQRQITFLVNEVDKRVTGAHDGEKVKHHK